MPWELFFVLLFFDSLWTASAAVSDPCMWFHSTNHPAVSKPVTVVVGVPVVVIDGLPLFWRDARAFGCSGPEGGDCGPWVT